jgi:predicted PurR-regulated permease PerM
MNRLSPERPPQPSAKDASPASGMVMPWQTVARTVLAIVVIGLGGWIVFDFLPALAWAGVLAIALWPLYARLLRLLPRGHGRVLGPALATVAIGIVIIGPLVLIGVALANEVHVAIRLVHEARHAGIPPPAWLDAVPLLGSPLMTWWKNHLSDPVLAQEMFGSIDVGALTYSARHYGAEIVHRLVILGFTLLTLFFVFRDGNWLAQQLRGLSDQLLGARGERIGGHMIAAVHGTVTGLVLVGIGEGIVLGVVYLLVGLPYPALVGAATGIAAIIPFGAVVTYCLAGLYLFSVGDPLGAAIVIASGSGVLFIADHFIRPALIGGAARLPFLLVLLGLLGGLETMGILGLFLGPAIMAALVALWREWTEPEPPASAPAVRPSPRAAGPHRPRR